MRAFVAVILTLILILSSWFFVYKNVEKNATSFIDDLTKTVENIEKQDWNAASKSFKYIKEKWDKTRTRLTIILDHHEIDNIDLSMAKTNKYIESQNTSLSLGEIEVLKKLFSIVIENEAPNISNIL